jgi:selenocysteine lyase/cysteine desulfurase
MAALSPEDLRAGIIGEGMTIETPFGDRRLIYADYVASGRALVQVERFVMERVLPVYSNSHTEASHCGRAISRLRAAARCVVACQTGAAPGDHVIFCGSGATAGINRLAMLLGIRETIAAGGSVLVLIGPYEHHSNILPWRESGATVIEIPEAAAGGPDMARLEAELAASAGASLVVGAFSAASNVTGRITDVAAVTRCLKAHGALAIWDYACAGPYLPIAMRPAPDAAIDALVLSPHKFLGGPGASGILVAGDSVVRRSDPTIPGGGTVSFVSPWKHHYLRSVEAREEAGTPNVVGDIRAALALLVKAAVGAGRIEAREETLRRRAIDAWRDIPNLRLLGQDADVPALPIFSFQVFGRHGQVHQQMVTRMLSDLHGVQARGGCACAGPYAHRLLGIDEEASEALFARLEAGEELLKPGWTRLNFAWCHSDDDAAAILSAVRDVALRAETLSAFYEPDPRTARFEVRRERVA